MSEFRRYSRERFQMSAIFELSIASETLTADEVTTITGCLRRTDQVEWLTANDWAFHKNRAGDPIVGRLYARLKLARVDVELLSPTIGLPDFSKAR